MNNYYEILELPITASIKEIKKAYKKLALKCHPDKGGDTDKFQKIQKAFNVLRDEEKKRLYDVRLNTTITRNNKLFSHENENEESDDNDSDTKNDSMNDDTKNDNSNDNSKVQKRKKFTANIEMMININLQDIYKHKNFKLNIDRLRCCKVCGGRGYKNFKETNCIVCGGDGIYYSLSNISRWCEHCWGHGKVKIETEQYECETCHGKGIVKDDISITISAYHCVYHSLYGNPKLKPRIIYHHEGNHLPFRNPGDLIIELNEEKDENLERDGLDIIFTKYITMYDAIFGLEFDVKHPSEKVFRISLKKMLDNDGMLSKEWFTQRIKGQGITNKTENGNDQSGDFVVNFKIIVPEIKSNEDQKALKDVFLSSSNSTNVLKTNNLEKHSLII